MYKPTWELEVIQKLHQESLTIQASMVQLPLFEDGNFGNLLRDFGGKNFKCSASA